MKTKVLTIFVLIVVLTLSACNKPASVDPSATPTGAPKIEMDLAATQTAMSAATSTPNVVPTATVAMPTTTPTVKSASGTCSLTDKGVKLNSEPEKSDGTLYTWKISEVNADYIGCALLFEGRIVPGEELHHVIILRLGNGTVNANFDTTNFQFAGGTFWAYPANWDMQSVGKNKMSIGEEFVAAKRPNMVANALTPYEYDIVLQRIGLDDVTYPKGGTVPVLDFATCQVLTQPNQIGIQFPPTGPYIVSAGRTSCWTAVLNDGKWTYFLGTGDNILVTDPQNFKAVMFPKGSVEADVKAWISKQ